MARTSQQRSGDAAAGSIARLIEIGIALSAERDHDRLLERILLEAKDICSADGGTLYLRTEDDCLRFAIMRTDSLGIALGGTTGKEIPIPPIPMYDPETGEPNHNAVASHVALSGVSINIPDVYEVEDFDFAGARNFDAAHDYRSTSFLTVPLKNNEGYVIGVLALLNAKDPETGDVIAFSDEIQPLIEALASQAAVALDNAQLLEAQKNLLDSFIKLIAGAIDAKSPYTGGHCQRVPVLSMMLAEAAHESDDKPFADFTLSDDDRYEMDIAALLHDCGKVTTPEYVVDKATKLETLYDRIHEVRMRFEVIKRDAMIECLEAQLEGPRDPGALRQELERRLAGIDDDFAFVAECNIGGEFMDPARMERIERIAQLKWTRTLDDRLGISHTEMERKERAPKAELPVVENLLADKEEHIIPEDPALRIPEDNPYGFKMEVPEHKFNLGEVYNLCIARGTLTDEERYKINDHVIQTVTMLGQLPFPRHLERVPEYAGGHHEKMDGTGYPRKLTKAEMSIQARIMAIADIFEALTACDRPYKKAKKLSESVRILSFMKKDRHIDPDLFDLFLESGVYRKYAEKFLMPEQIDEVDVAQYLNPPQD